jgi:hypothetical protein
MPDSRPDDPEQPIPPTNVRLQIGDRVIPVECVYVGQRGDGIHEWQAPTTLSVIRGNEEAAQLRADQMPPMTAVVLYVTDA